MAHAGELLVCTNMGVESLTSGRREKIMRGKTWGDREARCGLNEVKAEIFNLSGKKPNKIKKKKETDNKRGVPILQS